MNRVVRSLVRVEEVFISILLPIMCIVVFTGTVGRYTKLFTMPWGEELARYILVWIVFIGSAAAAREGAHFAADMIVALLPPKIRAYAYIIQLILHTIFCLFVVYYGFYITKAQITMGQVSASLQWPMWSMYMAVPVGCLLMMFHYIERCFKEIKSLKNTSTEEITAEGGSE